MSQAARIFVVLQTLAAFAIFIFNSGERSFWLDEAITIRNTRDWGEMWNFIASAESGKFWLHHIPVYLLGQFNQSEFWLRLYSVFFATATIPVSAILGRLVTGRQIGTIAGLFVAVNHNLLNYAQETRMYGMLTFFTALALLRFMRAVIDGGETNWLAYIATSILGMYTHLFAILITLSNAIAVAFMPLSRKLFMGIMASVFCISLAFGLSLSVSGIQGLSSTATSTTWIPVPVPRNLLGYAHFVSGQVLPVWFHIGLLAMTGLLTVIAMIQHKKTIAAARVSALLALIVPVATTYVFSTYATPVFLNRYLISGIVPYALIVTIGIVQLRQPVLILLAAIAYLYFPANNVAAFYNKPSEDWRIVAQHVSSAAVEQDAAVLVPGYVSAPFTLYSERMNVSKPVVAVVDATSVVQSSDFTIQHPRIWLVITSYPGSTPTAELVAAVESRYALVRQTEINGITVSLYSRKP